MANRFVQTPALSSSSIDSFLGQRSDRSGLEMRTEEFTAITNARNNELESLKKRTGGIKVFSQIHNTGTKVYGMHTYLDDADAETYIKFLQDGKMYKSTGGAWSQIGATTFTVATMFFATISTKDTGAANSASGTAESATATTLKDNDQAFTVNTHVGRVLTTNNEIKRIVANDATTLFVAERFDTTPSTSSYTVNPRSLEFFFANGTDFYKCDGTTFTRLDNSTFAYAFDGVESHNGRLWGWKNSRLHYSDIGSGEQFSRNSWIDFSTEIRRIKSFGEILVIFEERHVSALFGNDPSTFVLVDVLEGIGTRSPKAVAVYGDNLFFLSDMDGVIVLSRNAIQKNKDSDLQEPVSITVDYIQDDIASQTAANIAAACMETDKHHLHLCIDDDWYVLNVDASLKSRGVFGGLHWVWTKDDRPDAMDANVLGHFGTKFVAGAQDNGQVYELETGTDDDGTAIAMTIEKQLWNPRNTIAGKKFWKMVVFQNTSAGAVTMSYKADPDGSTYGSAIKTISLNTAGTRFHSIPFPNNPSDNKDSGVTQSIQITESGSLAVPAIEQLEILYQENPWS